MAAPRVEGGVTGHVLGLARDLPEWIRPTCVLPDRPALRRCAGRARADGTDVRQDDELPVDGADLVHLHFSTPTDLVPALEACGSRGLPVLTTDHMVPGGRWASSEDGWARRREASGSAAWSVADSGAIRDALVHQVGLDGARVRVVHHGVDTGRFRPGDRLEARRALGLPPDRPVLGAAGLLVSAKGVHHVLDACARLGGGVHVSIAGDGPERPRLEALARSLGLDARFLGFRDDMDVWLHGLDVLAHASDTEGFSSVLLEAMASRCPVVATAVGGTPELLASGDRGALVPAADPAALAAALRATLEAGASDPRLHRAYRAATMLYPARRTARRLARLYLSALGYGDRQLFLAGQPPVA